MNPSKLNVVGDSSNQLDGLEIDEHRSDGFLFDALDVDVLGVSVGPGLVVGCLSCVLI